MQYSMYGQMVHRKHRMLARFLMFALVGLLIGSAGLAWAEDGESRSGSSSGSGSLTVSIQPAAARSAGAQWRVDGGSYHNSGATVSRLSVGRHTVSFKAISGWSTPANQSVAIARNVTTRATGTYAAQTAQSGSLVVTIQPAAAVSAGAQWQVDGGAMRNSGTTLSGLTTGSHTLAFKAVSGWTAPASQSVTINANATTSATGTYTTAIPQTGSLSVTIQPAAAVTAGAQWQVDGGALQNSGATVSGLTAGSHTVAFRTITGWTAPASQSVTINADVTTTATGTYTGNGTQTGSLTVTIQPAGAVSAGAQWQVDAGTFHNSGATVTGLPSGTHTVSFSVVAKWIKPVSKSVTIAAGQTASTSGTYTQQLTSSSYTVLGYNELGMHCMNEDFSEFMILPPFNTFHAQVIRRGGDPQLVQSGVTVSYSIPSNTTSVNKTNFWTYAPSLFGQSFPADVGLTGNGLNGTLVSAAAEGRTDWVVTGIPITPLDDDGSENAYPLAVVTVSQNGQNLAQTQAVVPVSWEISCNLCHNTPGMTPGMDILNAHDRMHGTQLAQSTPVACGACHAQPALGFPGSGTVPSLSRAMHSAHASRMAQAGLDVSCYACHPGIRTQCLRDVHALNGMDCTSCHGDMNAVADPSRSPWVTEPRCGDCHTAMAPAGFEFEQPNTLFRNSKGHHGVMCSACHGSPHAITPTSKIEDNVQAIALQGHAGVIDTCTVCHTQTPDESFPHRFGGD